jgi:16S rRNA (guanine527-N7)-methyltransferase
MRLLMETVLKYFNEFTEQQLQQLKSLQELYKEWNEKINVISRKDIDSLYERHVLHSLSIAASFEFQPGTEIIDLGTGGGFPGIPLAIFFPEVKFHLVDSIAKKLKVVDAVAENICLTNVTTQHSRIEDIKTSPQDSARKFDFVVSRAVAPLKDLWRWSKPLLKTGKKYKEGDTKYEVRGTESTSTCNNIQHPTPKTQRFTHNSPPDSYRNIIHQPGLICLKGGDLAVEIQDSNTRPRLMEIKEFFDEEFFRDKFILYVSR